MGADAALANVYGYTPLILSAQFGYEEIAKILLYRDPGTLKHCCIGHNTCGMLLKLLKSVIPFEYWQEFNWSFRANTVKFRYSEKATKFLKMSYFVLMLLSNFKKQDEDFFKFCGLLRISDELSKDMFVPHFSIGPKCFDFLDVDHVKFRSENWFLVLPKSILDLSVEGQGNKKFSYYKYMIFENIINIGLMLNETLPISNSFWHSEWQLRQCYCFFTYIQRQLKYKLAHNWVEFIS